MAEGVVVVTGGSRGIGAEIAVASARAGNDVVIGFVDPKKQKRAEGVVSLVEGEGQKGLACRGDITDFDQATDLLKRARDFASSHGNEILALVLNAAGGLEAGASKAQADAINAEAPLMLAASFLIRESRTEHTALTKQIVYVTSHPSHFYGDPHSVMPSEGYEVVAGSKHEGESLLRTTLEDDQNFGVNHRLMVASADLVDDTAGATLLRLAHRRSTGDRSADLLAERSEQLQSLIGRGIANAKEFGAAIVDMFTNEDLPNGHTLYMPRPVLGGYVVPPAELPFAVGQDPSMYTFAT